MYDRGQFHLKKALALRTLSLGHWEKVSLITTSQLRWDVVKNVFALLKPALRAVISLLFTVMSVRQ
jgi:hypothetical protein